MATLIEQAAARLEQLRRAGVEVPNLEPTLAPPPAPAVAPTPADAIPAQTAAPVAAPSPASPPRSDPGTVPMPRAPRKPEAVPQSRRIELNLDAIAASGLVTPNAPRTRMADQYRIIKRPLIANATGRGATTVKHGNLIMVTSAVAGEGKSFTSINLAMSIAAELDHTVMLVDADVARPSVPRMLGLPASRGLLDVLEGKVELSEVLLRTNIDKLSILPAGSPHPQSTELLASESMTALLDDMATRYNDRIIIFDSPPLLLTTESRVLATHMGQIVVVVRADSTLQSTVKEALSMIEACPVKMMVLNQARTDSVGSYGSGYGYGYGYGGDSRAPGHSVPPQDITERP